LCLFPGLCAIQERRVYIRSDEAQLGFRANQQGIPNWLSLFGSSYLPFYLGCDGTALIGEALQHHSVPHRST